MPRVVSTVATMPARSRPAAAYMSFWLACSVKLSGIISGRNLSLPSSKPLALRKVATWLPNPPMPVDEAEHPSE